MVRFKFVTVVVSLVLAWGGRDISLCILELNAELRVLYVVGM